MAAANYVRDLSEYLKAGNLSDLTLIFGEKKWSIHKALVCSHSKWFQKAVTIGMQETETGVITLNDDPEFLEAIECMVSYFYNAGYDIPDTITPKSLLHAQVAIIAEKYDCASLYELSKSSFADTVKAVDSKEWIAIAVVIYKYMTTDLAAHAEFRKLVIAAVADRPAVLKTMLGEEDTLETFRSNADLATDLLLAKPSWDIKDFAIAPLPGLFR
ncbi:hypothetical protein DM02DRAFT_661971 [Periconia macrospinosa]|uniref:BTB domain-containing protein n=1 Tax=Periconia macrospinosa TaxID=97972 RepID=A0A2V1D5Z8_9PLEO|nr:hypothetical protein DM02DRAFT_661971 [Periconia macrospinosa]